MYGTCKRRFWPSLVGKRCPESDTLKLNSWYMKIAHLWGDEIKTIIEKARNEKQVMIKLLFVNVTQIGIALQCA